MSEIDKPSRRISVQYCCPSSISPKQVYSSGTQRFTDWYDFADWLKQQNEVGPVLIVSWYYV